MLGGGIGRLVERDERSAEAIQGGRIDNGPAAAARTKIANQWDSMLANICS